MLLAPDMLMVALMARAVLVKKMELLALVMDAVPEFRVLSS